MADILPGAEAWSAEGGPAGALVLHGFTGNPTSMRSLGEALAAAGFAVELPRLPGHGTTVEDMMTTTWTDWSAEVEAAYQRLAARTDKIVVTGLSMGGTLGAWITAKHPEIVGFAPINGAFEGSEEMAVGIGAMIDMGETLMDGVGNDIADPDQVESAYEKVPLVPLKSMLDAAGELQDALATISCPVLILNSPDDHVVAPTSSDHLAATVSGPVERVSLDRSYHVATQDYDKDLIETSVVAFREASHQRMSDLEPAQYVGIALVVAGLVAMLAIRFAVKMAFRTAKLVIAALLVLAGGVFYVNGGADEVQKRIDDVREERDG